MLTLPERLISADTRTADDGSTGPGQNRSRAWHLAEVRPVAGHHPPAA
jgi:hypothetical protein